MSEFLEGILAVVQIVISSRLTDRRVRPRASGSCPGTLFLRDFFSLELALSLGFLGSDK